ncbi:hypothetical protein BH24CHL2_BH24CHL2_7960 [soil metagenome]|jgi:hypothetical protein
MLPTAARVNDRQENANHGQQISGVSGNDVAECW